MAIPPYSEIEALVRARKHQAALVAIRRYLRSGTVRGRDDRIFEACDWYRRLGRFKEAYALVAPEAAPAGSLSSESFEGRSRLWGARLLNLMGANEIALLLANSVRPQSVSDHRILGNIYLTHSQYETAKRHFAEVISFQQDSDGYSSHIDHLGLADAYAGMGNYSEALRITKRLLPKADGPLLRGMTLQALGEFNALQERWSPALKYLREAESYFSPTDTSADRGYWAKWLGYVLCKVGQREEGMRRFKLAHAILNPHTIRSEAWIDVLRLQWKAHALSEKRARELARYPGLMPEVARDLPDSGRDALSASILIAAGRDEYSLEGIRHYGIPLELRALALIRNAGNWGMSSARIKAMLWPDEPHSFFQLDSRLRQLILRLRSHYDLDVEVDRRLLRMTRTDRLKIGVEGGSQDKPSFLQGRSVFNARELGEYYSLAKSRASLLIRDWIARGWVQTAGTARNTVYHPIEAKTSR